MAEIVVPLTFRGLTAEDVPACAWWGSPLFLTGVAEIMASDRDVEYLAACPPSGQPVAAGAIDFGKSPGAGVLGQLGVHGALQSCGIGTAWIGAAEDRIRGRGLNRAQLSVEESNPRARALYERLGYVAYGSEPASWEQQAPDGTVSLYRTVCTQMRKELTRFH
ncbi:MAG TPA: GNAT family N-acetyltransferase [Streptosporangiaceae bacterium]|nr:GNAT family N-acetyltransferase [Streptosporangiaceae bacterium]